MSSILTRCPRCSNQTPGHREGDAEYCTSCGGVLGPAFTASATCSRPGCASPIPDDGDCLDYCSLACHDACHDGDEYRVYDQTGLAYSVNTAAELRAEGIDPFDCVRHR